MNRHVRMSLLVLSVLVLCVLSLLRNAIWSDGARLWRDATGKSPAKDRVWYNSGVYYYGVGDFDLALANFTRATELNPGFADAWYNIGLINLYGRRFEPFLAAANFSRAIALNPADGIAFYERGVAYQMLGETASARADFAMSAELEKTTSNVPRAASRPRLD